MGTYSEALPTGGKLEVTENNWHIKYYFPGPDMRYNGTFFTIYGNSIDEYIDAWESNFQKYLDLKSTLSLDGTYETFGKKNMKISVGGFRDGVCIDGWHMNVQTKEKVNEIINDYKNAKAKAEKIMGLLKNM